jgi:hypothetical protein
MTYAVFCACSRSLGSAAKKLFAASRGVSFRFVFFGNGGLFWYAENSTEEVAVNQQQKLETLEQAALLVQQILSSLPQDERLNLSRIGFSRREQRDMRHSTYRLVGFLRQKRGLPVREKTLERLHDARARR